MKTFEEIAKLAVEKHQHTLGDTYFPSAEAQAFARAVACVALRIYTDEFKTAFSESKPTTDIPKLTRNPFPTGHVAVNVKPEYVSLLGVLCEALDQAQHGKGAERHNLGGDTPFDRQRMQTVSELVGSPDGMVYQAIKKITEGVNLPTLDRQVAELLGAINYIAGIIIFLRKRDAEEKTNGFYRVQLGEPYSGRETNQNIASATETLEKIATNLGIEPADLKNPWVDPVERMFGSFEDQLAAQEAKYPAIREHNERVREARRHPLEWRNHAGDKMPSTITPTTLVEVSYGDDRRSRGPVQAKAGDVDWSSIIEWRFSPKLVGKKIAQEVRERHERREQSAQEIMDALSQRAGELFPGLTFEEIFDLAKIARPGANATKYEGRPHIPQPQAGR